MTISAGLHHNDQPLEEAAAWLARLHELGVTTTPEFEAWRHSSPGREQAWSSAQRTWRYLGDQATAPELIARRGAALERAHRAGQTRWRDQRTRLLKARVMATAAAGLIAVAVGLLYLRQLPTTYRTDIGERRMLRLDDGCSVSLDSQSELSVRYTKHSRELTLVRGQGRFDVVHDVERPFSVEAGDRKVIATGTSFDVDLVGPDVVVTLIEGHVVVLDREDRGREAADVDLPREGVKLEPGERLVTSAQLTGAARPPLVQRVNLERATAWQVGQLVFDDETLAAAIERVNRYSRTKVSVTDSGAAALRLSGVFNEGDTKAFVDTVARYLALDEETRADGSVELKRHE
jgi:transmembrane sensor